jgi:hypothetical protein
MFHIVLGTMPVLDFWEEEERQAHTSSYETIYNDKWSERWYKKR